jgi:hypothetical protein
MQMRILYLGGTMLLLVGCGLKVKNDFVITETSSNKRPTWVKTMSYEPKNSEYNFFVSESDSVDRQLCERSASSRGSVLIASGIANKINHAYQEVAKSENLEKKNFATETLTQTIKNYLAGIEKHDSYWEKRSYRKALGSKSDLTTYKCFSLLKMKKSVYDKAVDLSIDKMLEEIKTGDKNEIKQEIHEEILPD